MTHMCSSHFVNVCVDELKYNVDTNLCTGEYFLCHCGGLGQSLSRAEIEIFAQSVNFHSHCDERYTFSNVPFTEKHKIYSGICFLDYS